MSNIDSIPALVREYDVYRGQVAWRLTDLEPLTEPILLSGLQGIWRLTHERRLAALQAQEKRATR